MDGTSLFVKRRPDAPTAYCAYQVVHGDVEGPPIGLVQHLTLYRGRPIYLEQPSLWHPRGTLWVDHRPFERYRSADGLRIHIGGEHLRIERWCLNDTIVPLRKIDEFLGIAPLCAYR